MISFLVALLLALICKDRPTGHKRSQKFFDFEPSLKFLSKVLLELRGAGNPVSFDSEKCSAITEIAAQIELAKMAGKKLLEPLTLIVEIIAREVKHCSTLRRCNELLWWRGIVVLAVNSAVYFLIDRVVIPTPEEVQRFSLVTDALVGGVSVLFLMFPFFIVRKFSLSWSSSQGDISPVFKDYIAADLLDEARGQLQDCEEFTQLLDHQWQNGVSTHRQRLCLIQQLAESKHAATTISSDRLMQLLPLIEAVMWTAATACLLGPKVAAALLTVDVVR